MCNFDRWDERDTSVLGYDAELNLIDMAEVPPKSQWKALERPPRWRVNTKERRPPENVKKQMVKQKRFESTHLEGERVAVPE